MSSEPIYTPFFGAMGATAAISFSGEFKGLWIDFDQSLEKKID